MAKLAPRQIDKFLANPGADVRAALVYGADLGLVRERSKDLLGAVAGDPGDPFRVAVIDGGELRSDPARLADEAAAQSLVGGRRAVHVRNVDDGVTPRFRDFLANPMGDALIVVEAGDLPGRSTLRRLFEGSKDVVAIACYHDDARSLPAVITELLRAQGLSASAEAKAYLVDYLGGDRQLTQREIEKLALYVGAQHPDGGAGETPRVVDLSAAQACIGDSAVISLDDLAYAVGDGDLAAVERAYMRGLQEGAPPIRALRAVSRHFENMHLVAGLVARGQPPDTAVKALRRPIFWRYAGRFRSQASAWPTSALGQAIGRLQDIEMACKQTGAPDSVLAARALLEIASRSPIRRGGRR
ncbi:MAG: DNA polymerase III subunit delta [Alphaproteobacteria bacterium]